MLVLEHAVVLWRLACSMATMYSMCTLVMAARQVMP
jgi:hypothetical protein